MITIRSFNTLLVAILAMLILASCGRNAAPSFIPDDVDSEHSGPDADADSDGDADSDSDSDSDADSDADADADSDSDSDADSDSAIDTDTDPDTSGDTDTGTGSDTDTGTGPDTDTGTGVNIPPVADIAPTGPVTAGRNDPVVLNGAGSFDPDGTVDVYLWSIPLGYMVADFGLTLADLSNMGIAPVMPDTLPVGPLEFGLTVTDNLGATDNTTVTINVVNGAPVIDCNGSEALSRTISVVRDVPWPGKELDFSASWDPDGDDLTFTFGGDIGTGGPCEIDFGFQWWAWSSTAVFNIPSSPVVLACQGAGPFTLTVIANDGAVDSAMMTINVDVINAPPVVSISGVSTLDAGLPAVLDGTGTTDPDPGDILTYAWTVTSASAPAVDCSADWITGPTTGVTLNIAAPVAAIDPECATSVVFWLEATDLLGEAGINGHGVEVTAAAPGHTLTASDYNVRQGSSTWGWVSLSPALVLPDTVSYTWVAAVKSGACLASDLTFGSQSDGLSFTQAQMSAAIGSTGCVFEVTITADINSGTEVINTTFDVTVTNSAPVVTIPSASEIVPSIFEATVPPGYAPSFDVIISDPDGWTPNLDYAWSGADLPSVTCSPAPACLGTATSWADNTLNLTFAGNPTPGTTYTFDLSVTDSDIITNVTLRVIVEPCVFVSTTPGNPMDLLGTFTNPYLVIQDAIDDAVSLPDTNVCIIEGTYSENVEVKHSPTNSPTISGGYSSIDGTPIGTGRKLMTIIENVDADGLSFDSDADNLIEYLTIEQDSGFFAAGAAAAVTIIDASPTLANLVIEGGAGSPAVGIDIVANTIRTSPIIVECDVAGSGRTIADDVVAINVSEVAEDVTPTIALSNIEVGLGTGLGVGFHIEQGATAFINDSNITDCLGGCDFSGITGVKATGGSLGTPASFSIADSVISLNAASLADDAFGIRLERTDRVSVTRTSIRGSVGNRAGIALADGNIFVDGSMDPGLSTNLFILDNPAIVGMGPPIFGGCNGTRFAVGVLLISTSNVTISGNHSTHLLWGFDGIRGGSAHFAQDWATDRLPPTIAGLWTINASGVSVQDSDIISGVLGGSDSCTRPIPFPITNTLLDGLPASLGFNPGSATSALVLNRNTIACSVNPENGAGMSTSFTVCVAADMQGSHDATLTNNIIATMSANENIGVRMSGGTSVDLVNNLIDIDLILNGPPPPPHTVYKWGIFADEIGVDALRVYNNIINIWIDDPYDEPTERLALREVVPIGTSSSIDAFANNLMYIEGDLLSTTTAPPYARIIDASSPATVEYAADSINGIGGINTNLSCMVDLPGLLVPSDPVKKNLIRTDVTSVGIDQAEPTVAPTDDIDNDPRGISPDIGHDEVL